MVTSVEGDFRYFKWEEHCSGPGVKYQFASVGRLMMGSNECLRATLDIARDPCGPHIASAQASALNIVEGFEAIALMGGLRQEMRQLQDRVDFVLR